MPSGVHAKERYVSLLPSLLIFLVMLHIGCGSEDYRQPVRQFQEASAVLVGTAHDFLSHMNEIEQAAEIDRLVFEQKPIDPQLIDKIEIITPEEIEIRVKALDELASYTTHLAELIQGKTTEQITEKADDLGKSLQQLAKNASSLPQSKGTFLDNAKFSNVAQAAATVIIGIARLLAERKARREVETAIRQGEGTINSLIQLVADELDGAYQRQRSTVSADGVYLWNAYKTEVYKAQSAGGGEKADPVLLLLITDHLKAQRTRQAALRAANPGPAVQAMRAAHSALVAYANSNKSPKNLAELVKAVQDFASRVQPLGGAIQTLVGGVISVSLR